MRHSHWPFHSQRLPVSLQKGSPSRTVLPICNSCGSISRFWASHLLGHTTFELIHAKELVHAALQTAFNLFCQGLLLRELGKQRCLDTLDMSEPQCLEAEDLFDSNLVQVPACARPNRHNDLCCRHWDKLLLLQQLRKNAATEKLLLGRSIKVRTELSEGGDLTVLCQLELQCACNLLHGLDLCCTSDTAHRQADIHSWTDTLVEQLGLQEDLPICNTDNIRRDVSTDIAGLRLNHRQCCQGSTTHCLFVHLRCPLKQSRVQIEHVTWIGLTTRWAPQQQRHLAVSHSLLGQIVIEYHCMLP
mmetsp:Transcript_18180/g.42282  ORF Transcript_18180/g.42282 Transcript_18180/m.42282 type:complete len:302 (+) Transcript_18180:32-937(+)